MKSLDLTDPALDDALVAYLMNDEPLPMLNGFPIRLVVPGKFGVYWIKHLTWIRALTREDTNYWMAAAYRIPDTPDGNTTPAQAADRKSTRLNSSHSQISYAVFCLKKKKKVHYVQVLHS